MKSTILHILSIIGTVLGLIIEGWIILDISPTAKIIDKTILFGIILIAAILTNIWEIWECSKEDKCKIDSCNKDTSSENNKSFFDWLERVAFIKIMGLFSTLLLVGFPRLWDKTILHIISITTLSIGIGATLICFLYYIGRECDTTIEAPTHTIEATS